MFDSVEDLVKALYNSVSDLYSSCNVLYLHNAYHNSKVKIYTTGKMRTWYYIHYSGGVVKCKSKDKLWEVYVKEVLTP